MIFSLAERNNISVLYIMGVYKYRVYCTDEQLWKTVYGTTPPIKCPDSDLHTITADSVSIVKKVSGSDNDNIFTVQTIKFNATENATTINNITFPYDMNLYGIFTNTDASYTGDTFDVIVAPDLHIGNILGTVTANDSSVVVPLAVFQVLFIGHHVKLMSSDDMNVSNDLIVVGKDSLTNTVIFNQAITTTPADQEATLTKVLCSRYLTKNYSFGVPGRYSFGEMKSGGMIIPKNTLIRVVYDNNDSSAKYVTFHYEMSIMQTS